MDVLLFFGVILFLFTWLGLLRGLAKELLVTFVVVLSIAVNSLLRRYIPLFSDLPENTIALFVIRVYLLIILLTFGYLANFPRNRLEDAPEWRRPRDWYLGALVGLLNGYLLAGTFFFYAYVGNYPLIPFLPALGTPLDRWMIYMPPRFLVEPWIYFAVIITLIAFLALSTNSWPRLFTRKPGG